jgi:hypothetical protein
MILCRIRLNELVIGRIQNCDSQWEPTYAGIDPEEALVADAVEELPEVAGRSLARAIRPQLSPWKDNKKFLMQYPEIDEEPCGGGKENNF